MFLTIDGDFEVKVQYYGNSLDVDLDLSRVMIEKTGINATSLDADDGI